MDSSNRTPLEQELYERLLDQDVDPWVADDLARELADGQQ